MFRLHGPVHPFLYVHSQWNNPVNVSDPIRIQARLAGKKWSERWARWFLHIGFVPDQIRLLVVYGCGVVWWCCGVLCDVLWCGDGVCVVICGGEGAVVCDGVLMSGGVCVAVIGGVLCGGAVVFVLCAVVLSVVVLCWVLCCLLCVGDRRGECPITGSIMS